MSSTDFQLSARGRLAVLLAHLVASIQPRDHVAALIVGLSSASAQIPPPRNLNVVNERTGRKYWVPVSGKGIVKATDLKQITVGKDDKGSEHSSCSVVNLLHRWG